MKVSPLLLVILLPPAAAFAREAEAIRILEPRILKERTDVAPLVLPERLLTDEPKEFLLPMEAGSIPLQDHEVLLSRDGNWEAAAFPVKDAKGRPNLVVREDEQRILRPETALAIPAMTREESRFPGVLVLTTAVRGDEPPEVLQGELSIQPGITPLRWDAERSAYVTSLSLRLDLIDRPGSVPLRSPVTVRFSTERSEVQPGSIALVATGVSGEETVELICRDRNGTASVTARSEMGEVRYERIDLDVRLGKLDIKPEEDRILGFGLGTTTLTIQRLAEDGRPLREETPFVGHLTAIGGGKFNPGDATIPPGESATTIQLRSRGLGERTIVASARPFDTSTPMIFTFPLAFLTAIVFGGAAGGVLKWLGKKEDPDRKCFLFIVEGCVVGLIVVAAVTAGLVIGNFPLPALGTELGAFLVAALSGYYGAPLVDHIAKTVFRKAKERQP